MAIKNIILSRLTSHWIVKRDVYATLSMERQKPNAAPCAEIR